MAIDTIGTNAIANNSVTAAKIPAGAVDADITTLPDDSVTTAKIASTAVTDAKLANDAVTSAKIAANALTAEHINAGLPLGRRNFIINGNGYINQRFGVNPGNANSSNTSINTYAMDRWRSFGGPGGLSIHTRVDGGAGEGNGHYMRFQRANGDSNTSPMGFANGIETRDSKHLAGKTVSLSFRARKGSGYSPTSSILQSAVIGGTGTDQNIVGMTGQTAYGTTNHTLTTSFQTFKVEGIAIPTDRTQLTVIFQHTPTGTAGGSDYYDIREVQLEIGSHATPFEYKPIVQELNDCYRYYYTSIDWENTQYVGGGGYTGKKAFGNNGWQNTWNWEFPTHMRSTPTAQARNTTTGTAGQARADTGGNLSVGVTGSNRKIYSTFVSNTGGFSNAYHYINVDAEITNS